ncbi:MAG: hypothetical protein V1844_03700 [Pseudomonadota bacterium]
METFAVYWEPIIKTYGIAERTGLCLISLDLPFDRISDEGACLSDIVSRFGGSLILIFSRPAFPAGLHLNLLLDRSLEKAEPEKVERVEKLDADKKKAQPDHRPMHMKLAAFDRVCSRLRVDNPVELVYFQGPHYGDRYGIAGAAVTALAKHDVPLLAVVCTGASVYLITPKGMACAAGNALGKAFSTPGTASPSNS